MGKFALLIGVSEYAEGLPGLPAAIQDVAAMQRVLADPSLGAFDEVTVLPPPTSQEMAETIDEWLSQRKAEDLILLFFSGHGIKDDRRDLYFAASNTRKQFVRSTAFEARQLDNLLRYSLPKQQVVILDCCYSGAFGAKDDGEMGLKEQLTAEGRVVLTSTSAVDYAFEDKESDMSVYTRYLVEGIEKGTADLNGDGFITIDELHQFASDKVKETSPAMSPDIIMLQGQGYNIRLATAPQDKPELRYRKEVENKAHTGRFTPAAQRHLKSLRRSYGLSDEVAEAIESEVLKPFRDYQRKLEEYAKCLTESLAEDPNLGGIYVRDLKNYQKYLGLKDKDVRPIEEKRVGRALRLETTPVEQPKRVERTVQQPSKTYPTFSFETVRVNEQGKVIETIPRESGYFTEELGKGVTLDMVRIPGGKFLMGAAEGEAGASADEYPQHEVTVPEFWLGKYVITQAQWEAVAEPPRSLVQKLFNASPNPSYFKGAQRPVEQVSWEEAVKFCKRLSQQAGREYTLPSEAQWEYACRAGTTTPFHFGPTLTTDLANYRGTDWSKYNWSGSYGNGPKGVYREKTTNVGSFKPNAFGLYDMHGNVWEWCLDGWNDSYQGAPTDGTMWEQTNERKVLRGGSWLNVPSNCRAANRDHDARDNRYYNLIGFRVCWIVPRT
jgi:formylglycine-generating enzyme required for sulfatase activity/uncharacterized caspase-like protein